jgi:hypothetical protein
LRRTALDIRDPGRENGGMSLTPETHMCPYCDLRFQYHNEVKDHIVRDHPDHAASVAGVEIHELPHD